MHIPQTDISKFNKYERLSSGNHTFLLVYDFSKNAGNSWQSQFYQAGNPLVRAYETSFLIVHVETKFFLYLFYNSWLYQTRYFSK